MVSIESLMNGTYKVEQTIKDGAHTVRIDSITICPATIEPAMGAHLLLKGQYTDITKTFTNYIWLPSKEEHQSIFDLTIKNISTQLGFDEADFPTIYNAINERHPVFDITVVTKVTDDDKRYMNVYYYKKALDVVTDTTVTAELNDEE